MDYRSLNINEFNNLNQSVVSDQAAVDAGMVNYEQLIRLGKAERAQMTLRTIRNIRRAVTNIFA